MCYQKWEFNTDNLNLAPFLQFFLSSSWLVERFFANFSECFRFPEYFARNYVMKVKISNLRNIAKRRNKHFNQSYSLQQAIFFLALFFSEFIPLACDNTIIVVMVRMPVLRAGGLFRGMHESRVEFAAWVHVEGVGARPRLTRLLKHLRRGGHPQPKVRYIEEGRAASKNPH
jgi:hypothetical protein